MEKVEAQSVHELQSKMSAHPGSIVMVPSIAGGPLSIAPGSVYGGPAAPGSVYGGPPIYGNNSVYGGSGSVYGGMAPAGSVYNDGGSMYQSIPVGGSVYGGAPLSGGIPMHPQGSGSIYGGGGSMVNGSVVGGVPMSGTGSSYGYNSSRMSVMPPRPPTDEEILAQIRRILSTADLMTVTRKSVREELARIFGMDLSGRKEFIHSCIDSILRGDM